MNIDTSDYLRTAQKDQQPQKTQSIQEVAAVQAVENDQTKTATIDAVKAPRYDTVNIDEEGFDDLAKSIAAASAVNAPVVPLDSPISPSDTSISNKVAQAASTPPLVALDSLPEVKVPSESNELASILVKLQARSNISPSELDFLRETSPADYAQALRAQQQQISPQQKTQDVKAPQNISEVQSQAAAMSMPSQG